jgi:hypothetical protein
MEVCSRVLHPPSQVAAAADEQLPHGNLYLGRALINAQIAACLRAYFAVTPPLVLSAGTSAYGRPKNDTPRIVDDGTL